MVLSLIWNDLRKHKKQKVKVEQIKTNMNVSILDWSFRRICKMCMKLLTANRCYALNGRTVHLLSQGEVDMSAATGQASDAHDVVAQSSDAEIEEVLGSETEVEISVVDKQ